MTKLLEKAIAKASKLPEGEQDALAALILEELESEKSWEKAFADSREILAKLAGEARSEHHNGNTQVLDPDRL